MLDGSSHSVDSSGMAFEIAGSMGFREALKKANSVLLEPVMNFSILVPDKFTGDVISDLNTKRGKIQGMTPQGNSGNTLIEADIPINTPPVINQGNFPANAFRLMNGSFFISTPIFLIHSSQTRNIKPSSVFLWKLEIWPW